MLVAPLVAPSVGVCTPTEEFLEKHQAGRRHVGERVILNSPWNTQVDDMRPPVSRQRRYCFTWNNYPLDAEEQLRSLAERKRIVVPREACYVVVVRRRRRYVTRRRRYAILFYFRKLNLHYVLQQNSKMILQVIENLKIAHCTLCMCYTHCTFVMCNPKHCTAHSYCG